MEAEEVSRQQAATDLEAGRGLNGADVSAIVVSASDTSGELPASAAVPAAARTTFAKGDLVKVSQSRKTAEAARHNH